MADPVYDAYKAYLKRADALLGSVEVGQYAKVKGRLVKRLGELEFATRWQEYCEVKEAFDESMARGDTVNDAVMRLLEDHASELLLEP